MAGRVAPLALALLVAVTAAFAAEPSAAAAGPGALALAPESAVDAGALVEVRSGSAVAGRRGFRKFVKRTARKVKKGIKKVARGVKKVARVVKKAVKAVVSMAKTATIYLQITLKGLTIYGWMLVEYLSILPAIRRDNKNIKKGLIRGHASHQFRRELHEYGALAATVAHGVYHTGKLFLPAGHRRKPKHCPKVRLDNYKDHGDDAQEFSTKDTFYATMSVESRKLAIISFRGTDSLRDLRMFQDMRKKIWWRHNPNGSWQRGGCGKVHSGVYQAFNAVRPAITKHFRQWNNRVKSGDAKGFRFLVTGHSLGGALASLCAMHLATHFPLLRPHIRLVTFAAPNTFTWDFVKCLHRTVPNNARVEVVADPVPFLPKMFRRTGNLLIKVPCNGLNPYSCHSMGKYRTKFLAHSTFNTDGRSNICKHG